MKTTKKQIEEKQKEIAVLREKLQAEVNGKFNHIIGKCYQLSATSIFRVDSIDYINEDKIECSGLHIYGNIKYANDFHIEKLGSGRLFVEEQNNEISKQQFIETMNLWYNEHRDYVTSLFL